MHVVVIGAGIVGVATAHYLRERGFDVTVVERRSGVAQEASFANGGMLAPDLAAPWARPGMPRALASALLRPGAAIRVPAQFDRGLWRWLRRWYRECAPDSILRNTARLRRLAHYSLPLLHELRDRHGIDYEQTQGVLLLFRTPEAFEKTSRDTSLAAEAGATVRTLNAAEARALEPALVDAAPLAGAMHFPDAETGNCALFARRVRDIAEGNGVVFRCGVHAQRFSLAGDAVEQLQTSEGTLRADAYVVAAGADSASLLDPVSVRVPVLPVLGYSLTAQITRHELAPLISVMDEASRVAVTRLDKRLRIAGLGRLGVRAAEVGATAERTLIDVARTWFPAAANFKEARIWSGVRPMLPDGPPVLGATRLSNLYLNVGHGASGWLLACGSARIVADLVAGRKPEIELQGLTIDRFAGFAAA